MRTNSTSTANHLARAFGLFALMTLFSVMSNPVQAQNTARTVSGVVKSLDGPLLGATVVLKGTNTAVITDEEGAFIFPTPLLKNDVLVISYLGYETDVITIGKKTTFVEPFLDDIPVIIVAALRTN